MDEDKQINNTKKIRIMVVDDEENIVLVIKIALEMADYEVIEAKSGEECMDKLQKDGIIPDLILLDIMMPGISGYETCEKIRSDAKLRDIKIVMLTAKGQKGDAEEGLKAGADDYIIKPFDPYELIEQVKDILER